MIKARFNPRLRTFANETTMHGFKEMYTSKKLWLRIGWLFIILVSFLFLIYQSHQATMDFLEGGTVTSVYPMTTGGYPLPVIAIGVPDWHWINYTKVETLGITPEMLAVIKSFLTYNTTWSKKFDVDKTKTEVFRLMEQKNLKNRQDLIEAIAHRNLLGLTNPERTRMSNEADDFTRKRVCTSDECIYYMNVVTSTAISDPSGKMKVIYGIEQRYIHQELSDIMTKYQRFFPPTGNQSTTDATSTKPAFLVDIQPTYIPNLYISDTWRPLPVYHGQDYAIIYTIRGYQYLSTSARPCRSLNPEDNPFSQKDQKSCAISCQIHANMTVGAVNCYPMEVANNGPNPWPICSGGIRFQEDLNNVYGLNESPKMILSPEKEQQRVGMTQECIERCLQTCDQYTVDLNVIIPPRGPEVLDRSSTFSSIFVRYPPNSTVLMTVEKEGYTWFTYVSNLGGILGLWLGASMMSFWQTIYLCLYPESEDEESMETGKARNKVMPAMQDKAVQIDRAMVYDIF